MSDDVNDGIGAGLAGVVIAVITAVFAMTGERTDALFGLAMLVVLTLGYYWIQR